jgi:tetratricopeptide (TPR) repeat protein
LIAFAAATLGLGYSALAQENSLDRLSSGLVALPWVRLDSSHFSTFSSASETEAAKLTARLEQFREAYARLAGVNAVASPPIAVIALPNHAALVPFLPRVNGKPMNLAAYFHRDSDENLIVLSTAEAGNDAMQTIFHEYTHLLLRRNDAFWPLWLEEGMAEVYSTFHIHPGEGVAIGGPLEHHLRTLKSEAWFPLAELFSVNHSSPAYNEQERQGVFYAQSWLLTHYLMLGDNSVLKTRFAQLTPLLRAGQNPQQAFTNALGVPLPVIEKALKRYLEAGRFQPLKLSVPADFAGPKSLSRRSMSKPEVCYRLGDVLMRIREPDRARKFFENARALGPGNPLGYEGLGLLEARAGHLPEAVAQLSKAIELGSTNFLAYYALAESKYGLTSDGQHRYTRIPEEKAGPVRENLKQAISLMPNFGGSHHLLGFFEMVQGDNPAAAEQQLKMALALDQENSSYAIALAQAQIHQHRNEEARQTLQPLLAPYVRKQIREPAQELMDTISRKKQ